MTKILDSGLRRFDPRDEPSHDGVVLGVGARHPRHRRPKDVQDRRGRQGADLHIQQGFGIRPHHLW